MLDLLFSIDCWLFLLLNRTISNPLCDVVIPFVTDGKHWIIPIIVAVVIFYYKERRKALLVIFLSIVTVSISDPVCVRVFKEFFHRMRPCNPAYFIDGHHMFLVGAHFLSGLRTSFSFPSAHAMNAFSQAMLFFLFYPKSGYYFFPLALFIGFTRIYIGVHYPSDVVGGALIGMVLGYFIFQAYRRISKSIVKLAQSKHISVDEA